MSRESGFRGLRRAGIALVMFLAVTAAQAAPAGAATLGNPDMDYVDSEYGTTCGSDPCIWMQTKIPGAQTRAPFSGVITTWRMAQPQGGNEGRLVVMRKARHGKFTAIRASHKETTPNAGTFAYSTHLKIKKGDYIALYGSSAMGKTNVNSELKLFDSALALGQPKKPDQTYQDTYFYNATVEH